VWFFQNIYLFQKNIMQIITKQHFLF